MLDLDRCHCQVKIPQFLPIEISPDISSVVPFFSRLSRTFAWGRGEPQPKVARRFRPLFAHPPCWPAFASTPAFFLSFSR